MTEKEKDIIASLKEKLEKIHFAHPSEKVCAEILTYYGIRWEYEPHTFPIDFDRKGRVLTYFTPDFYLPDFDLYIELTTMNQKLVTKKNRKVRRLKELFPDIKIMILYQRDFRNLILKYGLVKKDKRLLNTGSYQTPARKDKPVRR
jgi:hypoxanthine phosphoribosyltransferase